MRIRSYLFYLFVSVGLFLGCSINKKLSSKYNYKGEIENANDYTFKYFLSIDSFSNLQFKIYDLSGIKLGEFILSDDSLDIKYIIDNSFKEQIFVLFKKFNNEHCLKEIVFDIFTSAILIENDNFNLKNNCYNRNFVTENGMKVCEISNLKYDRILSISEMRFSKRNYEIILNDGIKLKLKIIN
jgi:hypothetical protein